MTYQEWKNNNSEILSGKSEHEMFQMYQQYMREKSSIDPIVEDVSDKKTPSSLQQANTANNIDMLETTDFLTQIGVATGNSTLTKAGLLGSTAVNAIQQLKGLKGLKGINKTAGISGVAGGVADSMDRILFGDQWAKNSNLTNGMNSVYDMTSSAIMGMGGAGILIGGGMKLGGLLSDSLSAMGVGTDQMTTTDKILDSKFLKLTPVGLVNAIGAKSSDKFTVDNNIRSQIGGSYGGAYAFMDDAASKANKKYGLFSSGSRHRANRKIAESKLMQSTIGNINKEARDMQSIVDNSSDLLSTNYQFNLSGGYDQRYIRAAKFGDKIQRIKKINFSKKGGQIHQKINLETKSVEWEPIIIQKQGGTINQKYEWEPTIIQNHNEDINEWEPIIIYKNGGKSNDSEEKPLSNQQNVIPEGALHARKHHMENTEGLTQKGIPVIDNKGEQQAEIELNEIIFNLEVTKKLEELCKDGSDEAAIEAGKLLVQEILFNTEDRTGLINTLKQGGIINGNTE